MRAPYRRIASAVVLFGAVSACGGSDGDESIQDAVLACISDGGGVVGDDADVAIAGGKAVAVIGDVEAKDSLIESCLD